MSTRKETVGSAPDLAPAYEELRSVMVDQRPGGGALAGLGILLMRGLAAWVEVSSSSLPAKPVVMEAQRIQYDPGRLPVGTAGEVVNVLTSMTMDAVSEVAI